VTRQVLSYFICCTKRSGSYLLCEALENTGLAGRPSEHIPTDVNPWHPGFTLENYRASFRVMIEKGTTGGIFGCKAMWPWFGDLVGKLEVLARRETTPVDRLLAELFPNPHYIMLTRRDRIRQAISVARAEWTNVWKSTEARYPRNRVEDLRIDPRTVDHEARVIANIESSFDGFFDRYGISPFRVVYEDLVERYEETALEILDFLGIPHPAHVSFGERRLERQWDAASDELLRQYYAAKGFNPIGGAAPRSGG